MRNKNIELLRVISMFQIGILHAFSHGGALAACKFGTVEYAVLFFIEALCMSSVNVFVLISGYFLSDGTVKISRIIHLCVQVMTYSIMNVLLFKIVVHGNLDLKELIKAMTPLSSGVYWFASAYAIMLILSPVFNLAIRKMSESQLKATVILLVSLFSVYTTVLPWARAKLTDGYSFIWFSVLYFVSAYMRRCHFRLKKPLLSFFGMALIMLLSRIIIGVVTKQVLNGMMGEGVLYTYSSLPCLLAAVALVGLFVDAKEKNASSVFAPLGRMVFGAYLISDHSIMRDKVWEMVNITGAGTDLWHLLASAVIASIGILVVGSVVEMVRLKVIRLTKIDSLIAKSDQFSIRLSNIFDH